MEVRHSLALWRFFSQKPRQEVLWSLVIYRRLLGPYTGILDGAEMALDSDLTAFAPRPDELGREDYVPEAVGGLLDRLRNSAVSRVLSLDPLLHPDLVLRARIPAGPDGLFVHAYEVLRPWPRAHLVCAVQRDSPVSYRASPHEESGCGGTLRLVRQQPAEARYEIEADHAGYVVVKNSYAKGWRAEVDGQPQPVLRINGKHQGVPVPAGRHVVVLRYQSPGLRLGVVASLASLCVCLVLLVRPVLVPAGPD